MNNSHKTPFEQEMDALHSKCGHPQFVTETLKQFRKDHNLTVKWAAWYLGVPARTLEGVEQGREFPYPALLVKLIKMYPAPASSSDASPNVA
ncbi:helix-turn-helix domain-containing protein [Phyllobacterium lublinensis]|uniref:helix-turn-helix domain-containing protein n=1 Tax=Phyllobacterium lublinensis TaxID=2875708 RepID=UPI001CCACD62|nr:helix-turn-helix transcriptional regulator [Phyllobacterium sp. 2063]MBZ9654660.1 helix-turn-helix domain-containing protein [Phyllobacterium sp. 2063]